MCACADPLKMEIVLILFIGGINYAMPTSAAVVCTLLILILLIHSKYIYYLHALCSFCVKYV